jgi:hypothetical protein
MNKMNVTQFFIESIEEFMLDDIDSTDYNENEIMNLFHAIEGN